MVKMAEMIFARTEKKYRISAEKKERFLQAISPYVDEDAYGRYSLCNIYFDTQSDELIRTSIEKPIYKEKLRLRSYGVPCETDEVFLEIKKKYKGVVYKRRVMMTLQQAMEYIKTGKIPVEADSQIMREIDYFINFYHPEPKLYLAYDRLAFTGREDPQLRITVDEEVRSRRDRLDLTQGDEGERLLGDGEAILEIKTNGAMPLWLTGILAQEEIYPISFSKYGEIYKRELLQREKQEKCTVEEGGFLHV